jgi:Glycosyl hydrolases family 17
LSNFVNIAQSSTPIRPKKKMSTIQVFILLLILGCFGSIAEGLGVNWGTMANHPLPPKTVVQVLKDNGIKKVKLFDADPSSMSGLAGSNIEVMVGIPNIMLGTMTDYDAAKKWVNRNVTQYNFNGGVNVK